MKLCKQDLPVHQLLLDLGQIQSCEITVQNWLDIVDVQFAMDELDHQGFSG